jgi:nucleotide-binding universal stress UspA family protein
MRSAPPWLPAKRAPGTPSGLRCRLEELVINLKKILVPTDFSDGARHALTYGSSFAREYKAELLLLHVVETVAAPYASDLFPVPMAEVFEEMSGYARTELEKLAALARERGVDVRTKVAQGKPSLEIMRIAREEETDMIVLGTHGKGVLDQALFGSTTERVVRKAPCPVLCVRLSEHEFVEDK